MAQPAPSGITRREVVTEVVDSFAKTHDYLGSPNLHPLIEHILKDVMTADDRWLKAQRDDGIRFDLGDIHSVLFAYVTEVDRRVPLSGLTTEELKRVSHQAEEAVRQAMGEKCDLYIFTKLC
ncbi:hypothetical protein ACWGAN_04540 [Streptomyces sp. NPDC054945]